MHNKKPLSALIRLALPALALALPVVGTPINNYVSAGVAARGNGSTSAADTGQIAGPVAAAGPVGFSNAVAGGGTYSSAISASAAYGHLSGSANAAQTVGTAGPVQSDAETGEQLGYSAVSFFDTITPTSAAVPAGTYVDVYVDLTFKYTASAGPDTCCGNVGINGLYALSPGALNVGIQAAPGQSLSGTVTRQLHLLWQIGSANLIGAYLSLSDGSSPGVAGISGNSASSGDAMFVLHSPDPSVVFSAASGAAYAAPEPSTLLLAAPLLALALLRKRRNPTPRTP